jgi:importin subunit alpha-1
MSAATTTTTTPPLVPTTTTTQDNYNDDLPYAPTSPTTTTTTTTIPPPLITNNILGITRTTTGISDKMKQRLQQLPSIIHDVYSDDVQTSLKGTESLRKILSIERGPPIEEVINTGIIPRLIELMSNNRNQELQFESAWALTNILSGIHDHVKIVIDAGIIPPLIQLLDSPNDDVQEQAVWAFGNILGDCIEYRDMVLDGGVLPKLLQLISRPDNKLSFIRNTTWAISNCFRGKPGRSFNEVQEAVPIIVTTIQLNDDDTISESCYTIGHMCNDAPPEIIDFVASNEILNARLIQLLQHANSNVHSGAAFALCNMLQESNDDRKRSMVDLEILPLFMRVVNTPTQHPPIFGQNDANNVFGNAITDKDNEVKRDACTTIGSICTDSLMNVGWIPFLITLLYSTEIKIRQSAMAALKFATLPSELTKFNNDEGQNTEYYRIPYIIASHGLKSLCHLINKEKDISILTNALDTLENILKYGEIKKMIKDPYSGNIPSEPKELVKNPYAETFDELDGVTSLYGIYNNNLDDDGKVDSIHQQVLRIVDTYFPNQVRQVKVATKFV